MSHYPMHSFDVEHVRGMLSTFQSLIGRMIPRLGTGSHALSVISQDGLSLAGLRNSLERQHPQAIVDALRLAGRCGAALFSLARANGSAIELCLESEIPTLLKGEPDESTLHAGRWLDSFCAAFVSGDTPSLVLLSAVSTESLRRSSSRADEWVYHLVDALRACWQSDPTAGEHLLNALRATDSGSLMKPTIDRVLNLAVPALDVLFAGLQRDQAELDATLGKALELHGRYWGSTSRRDDPEGLLALRLSAMVAFGLSRGMSCTVSSDYIPPILLQTAVQSAPRLLCPYCLTPITSGASICPGCLGDPRADAAIESDDAQIRLDPRKQCLHCGAMNFSLAVVCPTCRQRF
jgi:hypothetical protein